MGISKKKDKFYNLQILLKQDKFKRYPVREQELYEFIHSLNQTIKILKTDLKQLRMEFDDLYLLSEARHNRLQEMLEN